jgi:hypothetical protein
MACTGAVALSADQVLAAVATVGEQLRGDIVKTQQQLAEQQRRALTSHSFCRSGERGRGGGRGGGGGGGGGERAARGGGAEQRGCGASAGGDARAECGAGGDDGMSARVVSEQLGGALQGMAAEVAALQLGGAGARRRHGRRRGVAERPHGGAGGGEGMRRQMPLLRR